MKTNNATFNAAVNSMRAEFEAATKGCLVVDKTLCVAGLLNQHHAHKTANVTLAHSERAAVKARSNEQRKSNPFPFFAAAKAS